MPHRLGLHILSSARYLRKILAVHADNDIENLIQIPESIQYRLHDRTYFLVNIYVYITFNIIIILHFWYSIFTRYIIINILIYIFQEFWLSRRRNYEQLASVAKKYFILFSFLLSTRASLRLRELRPVTIHLRIDRDRFYRRRNLCFVIC